MCVKGQDILMLWLRTQSLTDIVDVSMSRVSDRSMHHNQHVNAPKSPGTRPIIIIAARPVVVALNLVHLYLLFLDIIGFIG